MDEANVANDRHSGSRGDWLQNALSSPGHILYRDAQAYAVLAMAQHQLNRPAEARAALIKGSYCLSLKTFHSPPEARIALAQGMEDAVRIKPKSDSTISGDFWLEADWWDWVMARVLLREAKALIGAQPAAKDPTAQK